MLALFIKGETTRVECSYGSCIIVFLHTIQWIPLSITNSSCQFGLKLSTFFSFIHSICEANSILLVNVIKHFRQVVMMGKKLHIDIDVMILLHFCCFVIVQSICATIQFSYNHVVVVVQRVLKHTFYHGNICFVSFTSNMFCVFFSFILFECNFIWVYILSGCKKKQNEYIRTHSWFMFT